jgi:hypothetical protein
MTLMRALVKILFFALSARALLMPNFCGSISNTQCINVDFTQLDATRNSNGRVDTPTLKQSDDAEADSRDPGEWELIRSRTQIREKSGIRQSATTSCPGDGVFGSYLRFLPESNRIAGFEREFRVVFSSTSNDSWVGVAFGFQGNGDSLFRVLLRPSCVSLQRRANGSPFITIASSARGTLIGEQYEVRVRYGNGFVLVRLVEFPSLRQITTVSSTSVADNAVTIGGDYALFSSDSSETVFESFILIDTEQIASVNEPQPFTDAPTPAPTPGPTSPPTPAPTPAPSIDCQYSAWSAWSACSQTARCMIEAGRQSRVRTIIRQSSGGGIPCGVLNESQVCNADVPCPTINCNCVGCSSQNGVGTATWCRCCQFSSNPNCTSNSCTTNNIHVKSGCIDAGWCQVLNSTNTKHCGVDWFPNEDYCNLPIACQVGQWSAYDTCSRSCISAGGSVGPGQTPNGMQTRSRNVTRAAKNGGMPCPALTETAVCNTTPCPQDCIVSQWGPFSACSTPCSAINATEIYTVTGTVTRTRNITTAAANGGAPCPGLREDQQCSRECIPDVDCIVSAYGQWSSCRASTADPKCVPPFDPRNCGNGVTTRTRSVVREPLGNGLACPTQLSENDMCSVQCSVNCVVGEWAEWATCSQACGTGSQRRTRAITVAQQHCGGGCLSLVEQRTCNIQTCVPQMQPVDCVISNYTVDPTERCSVPACGNGTISARATVVTPPYGTGKACPPLTIGQPCNTAPCPAILNTPGIRWRIVSNDSIGSFVWLSFRLKLAYYLAIDEDRLTLRSVMAGSTIVEFAVADAVDDDAQNYTPRLQRVAGDNSSQLNAISSMPVAIPTTTAEPTVTRTTTTTPAPSTTTTVTTSTSGGSTTSGTGSTTRPPTTTPTTTSSTTSSSGPVSGTTTTTVTPKSSTSTTSGGGASTTTSSAVETSTSDEASDGSTSTTVTSSDGNTETIVSNMGASPNAPALSDELVIIIAVVASVLGCSLIVSLILGFFFMCRRKSDEPKKSNQAVPMYPVIKEDDEKSDGDVFVAESLFESQSESEDAKPEKRRSGRRERSESGSGRRERSSSRTDGERTSSRRSRKH